MLFIEYVYIKATIMRQINKKEVNSSNFYVFRQFHIEHIACIVQISRILYFPSHRGQFSAKAPTSIRMNENAITGLFIEVIIYVW